MKNKFAICLLLAFTCAKASVRLPNILASDMVLQRNATVTFWGWADPNEEITIITGWDKKEYKVKTGSEASWSVQVATPQAGGPYEITISGYNSIVLRNILIGEVWLCSGQSNMEMTAGWGIKDGETEIKAATDSNIRLFTVAKASSRFPQDNASGNWASCSPEAMKNFSAVGYFFAKQLREEMKDIPIGLVCSAWGGTAAEIWIPENAITSDPVLKEAASKIKENVWCPYEHSRTYNAMIHPITNFEFAGVLWYQGESNVGSSVYDKTLSALIQSWRDAFRKNLPFFLVQIASYDYGKDHDGGAVIRNAQLKVSRAVPDTYLVVSGDVSDPGDLHPKDKKTAGIRLANLALQKIYHVLKGDFESPILKTATPDGKLMILDFEHAHGLKFGNGASTSFEIAGADGVFYTAKATLQKERIILVSNKVKKPVKVRYCWANNAVPNIFNENHLPLSTFTY